MYRRAFIWVSFFMLAALGCAVLVNPTPPAVTALSGIPRDAVVVLAIEDIPKGTLIRDDQVRMFPYPSEYLVETMTTDVSQVAGRVARTDIVRGGPVTTEMLADPSDLAALGDLIDQRLRAQAEAYLVQLTRRLAREGDLTLDRARGDVEALAAYTASLYNNASDLARAPFWSARDHMRYGPDGQYVNGPDDASSVFVPSGTAIDAAVLRDLELSGYLDLVLPAMHESDPNAVAIYFGTPRGVVRYYPNIDLGSILDHDFQVTSRPWYTGSLEDTGVEMGVYWTPVYEDAAGRGLVTTASIPVYDQEGRLAGVVGIDLSLGSLAAEVEGFQILRGGYAFLIDGEGVAIALPEQGYHDLLGRPPEGGEIGPGLSGARGAFAPLIERMLAGRAGFEIVGSEGRELFVAYSPLETAGWSVACVLDVQEALGGSSPGE